MKQLRLAELRDAIAIGSAEADRGEFVDGRKIFAAIRKRGAVRKRSRFVLTPGAARDVQGVLGLPPEKP